MGTKRALAERLHGLAGFPDPDVSLEQYPTPADLAAHLVHLADLQGDLADRTVVDLGAGTGILALAAALRGPARVVGIERDPAALDVARENERRVAPPIRLDWVLGDATRAPFCLDAPGSPELAGTDSSDADADLSGDAGETPDRRRPVTALLNPPFGAQTGREGADRAFLRTAVDVADVSYSIHNADSQAFLEAFAADNAGEVTHAFRASFEMDRLYDHHASERAEIDVEIFRIEWG